MTDTTPEPPRPRRLRWRVVAWFALGLVALDVAVGATGPLWRSYSPVYYRDRLAAARERTWDVVVAGGSAAMCGIDTDRLVGADWRGTPVASAFNLGLPLATTAEVSLAAEHGLGERPPRLLVYAITASDLNGNRVVGEGPQYLMGPDDLARWAGFQPARTGWSLHYWARERLSRAWHLRHHGTGIRLWAADQLDATSPGVCPDEAEAAHLALTRTAGLASPRGPIPHPPAAPLFRLDLLKAANPAVVAAPFPYLDRYEARGHLPYLHRLLDWANGRGVPVVLLDLPVSADLDGARFPKEFAAYRDVMAEVERDRHVPVLRATRDAVGLTDADFGDLVHLNADGAAKLSDWLRGRLAAVLN